MAFAAEVLCPNPPLSEAGCLLNLDGTTERSATVGISLVTMALTSAQRSAQRSLVGLIRAGSAVVSRKEGLSIWRARGSEEWQVSVEEITNHLDVLEVPYSVAVVLRPAHGKRPRQAGFSVQVEWDRLDSLVRWAPSLRVLMDAVEESPGGTE
jgi:hypothetical protein